MITVTTWEISYTKEDGTKHTEIRSSERQTNAVIAEIRRKGYVPRVKKMVKTFPEIQISIEEIF